MVYKIGIKKPPGIFIVRETASAAHTTGVHRRRAPLTGVLRIAGGGRKVGLSQHEAGAHAVGDAGRQVEDQNAVTIDVSDEKPVPLTIVDDTARTEMRLRRTRGVGKKIRLTEDIIRNLILQRIVGIELENKQTIIEAVGNKKTVMDLVDSLAGAVGKTKTQAVRPIIRRGPGKDGRHGRPGIRPVLSNHVDCRHAVGDYRLGLL